MLLVLASWVRNPRLEDFDFFIKKSFQEVDWEGTEPHVHEVAAFLFSPRSKGTIINYWGGTKEQSIWADSEFQCLITVPVSGNSYSRLIGQQLEDIFMTTDL